MLTILNLCPDELESYDPFHYGRSKLSVRFPQQSTFNPPSFLLKCDPSHVLDLYLQRFCSTDCAHSKHAPIVQYDLEMAKKFGPQGGHFTFETLCAKLRESYDLADAPRTFSTVLRGRDALLKLITLRVARVGFPSVNWVPSTQDTAAGLPRGGRKTEWRNHVDGADNWLHPLPAVPAGRRQRQKDRVIYEDACLNVDYVMPPLNAVRGWLKTQFPTLFSAWLNPHDVKWPQITSQLIAGKTFLETDYKAMDNHFSWELVENVILPIYSLLLPEAVYLHFAAFIQESFSQPLFLGEELWTGLHNLFSGQGPTNDFETDYDVCLYLGAHLEAGGTITDFLSSFEGLGDDVLYAASEDMCKKVYDIVAREATANGLVLSLEKTRMQSGEARFCREVYYLALPRQWNAEGQCYVRPSYPPVLALNSVCNPEHLSECSSDELLRDFTRMDNIEGYYRHADVANMLWPLLKQSAYPADADARFEVLQMRDWWFTVYGTTYGLGDSWSCASFREYHQALWLPMVIPTVVK